MKKIYIGGLAVSGKGLMKQLLDGHSQLCIIPFQGFILKWLVGYDFGQLENDSKLLNPYRGSYYESLPFFTVKDNGRTYRVTFDEFIRNIYYYYDLYAAYRAKRIWGVAAAGVDISVDFIFDYFSYEQEWFERLFEKHADVSTEEFLDIIYLCFINNWKNSYVERDSEYAIATPLQNGINPIHWILKNTINTKMLLMERDCVGFSYALAKKDSLYFNKPLNSQLFSLSYVNTLKEYRDFIHSPAISDDPRVMVVDFEKLVLDTRKTMSKVADFLGIAFKDVLTIATLNKIPLETENRKFTGMIQEDPYKAIPPDAIEFLRYLYGARSTKPPKIKTLIYGIRAFKLIMAYNVKRFWQRFKKILLILNRRFIKKG